MPTKAEEDKQIEDEKTGTADKLTKMPVPSEKKPPKTTDKFIAPQDADDHGYLGMRHDESRDEVYDGTPIVQHSHPAHELPVQQEKKPKSKK